MRTLRFTPWAGSPGAIATVVLTPGPVNGVLAAAALEATFTGVGTVAAPAGVNGVLASAAQAATFSGTGTVVSGLAPGTALLAWAEGQYNRQQDANVLATYMTSATAYSVTSASDQIRIEDTGDGNGSLLLCEGSRACINIQSRTVSGWTNDNGATSVADTHVSPDGGTNADSVTFAATTISGKSKTQTGTNVPSSVNLAFQCWAKSGTGGDEKFVFNLANKSGSSTPSADQSVNQGWQRYTWDRDSGAGAGNPTLRLWNASDAVARGAGRIVVFGSMCVEAAPFPSSLILNEAGGQNGIRHPDLLIYPAELVPLHLRAGKHATGARTKWSTADLAGLSAYLYSFGGANDGLRFFHTGSDVRLQALVGGVVVAQSGPVTATRGGYLPIVVDPVAGVITVNGVAGATGTPWAWPGGVPLRMGGILGGTSEACAGSKVPEVAA
jgi:hypothetical protein